MLWNGTGFVRRCDFRILMGYPTSTEGMEVQYELHWADCLGPEEGRGMNGVTWCNKYEESDRYYLNITNMVMSLPILDDDLKYI